MYDSPYAWLSIGWGIGVALGILLGRRQRLAPEEPKWKRREEQAIVGALGAGLAHELRNPLSALRMNLQLLQEDWQNPVTEREKKGARKIEVLLRETNRLQSTLDNFLKFAAEHHLRREPVNLNRLLEELTAFVAPRAERAKIELRKEFDSALPDIDADPNLIRQAVMNLMINAEQAMPEGGTLTLRTEKNGRNVRLRILDTGKGIPASIQPRVFELFFSTRPSGTGLGLSLTKKIVEEHDGTIDIRSEPDRGTEATIELPYGR